MQKCVPLKGLNNIILWTSSVFYAFTNLTITQHTYNTICVCYLLYFTYRDVRFNIHLSFVDLTKKKKETQGSLDLYTELVMWYYDYIYDLFFNDYKNYKNSYK